MYEDFVLETEIEFEIEDKKFGYKPVTAGDELSWIEEYTQVIDGKAVQSFEKKTLCKLRNIISVPWDKKAIEKIIGVEKDWKDLNNSERVAFFKKMTPIMFDKIINKINEIDMSDNSEVKKN